jgi:hypothetical protein
MKTLKILALFGVLAAAADCRAQLANDAPARMADRRSVHTATRLADGRILFTGGFTDGERALSSAEIFDPSTGKVKPTRPMNSARQGHTASLLPNGNVLVSGGFDGEYLDSAEIFDVASESFGSVGKMTTARSGHVAVTLRDGKILLAGGVGTGWSFLADAEIFDPASGRFERTGGMIEARESHTAVVLGDGRVLIAGGHRGRRAELRVLSSAEIYDPKKRSFTRTGEMTIRRHKHDAVEMSDGRVLLIGGADERDRAGAYSSVETFDPRSGRFEAFGEMNRRRYKLNGTSVRLNDGRIFIGGGAREAEVLDPKTRRFSLIAGDFGSLRLFATATALADGRIALAGGYDERLRVATEIWIVKL